VKLLANGIEISDTDALCLENDLLDKDEWVRAALWGKINNCKKRLINHWHQRLLADPAVKSLPGDTDALVKLITSRADYQNRRQRDAAEVEEIEEIEEIDA